MLAALPPTCAEEQLHHTCTGRGRQPEQSLDAGQCEVAEKQQAHQGPALRQKRLGLSVSLSLVPSHLDPQGPTPLPQHHCSEPLLPLNFVPSESPAFHMAFTVGASHFQPQGPMGWWLSIYAHYTHDGSHAEAAVAVVGGRVGRHLNLLLGSVWRCIDTL